MIPRPAEVALEPATDRAARGARFLDPRIRRWIDRVDSDTLDIGSCVLCVFGQLFGRFQIGLRQLAPAPTEVHSHTNWAYDHGFLYDGPTDREALNAAWRAEIARRVGAP